jgi:peptidoglycan/LPS O-acetylase OafA/YrhL
LENPASRSHGLDTLRACAILAVMAFHRFDTIPEPLIQVTRFGWMGVDLFFVLSGYLIGSQLLKPYSQGEAPRFWEFYRKRLYRVLPAYVVVLALYYLAPWWRESPKIGPLWQLATFTANLLTDYTVNHAFSQAWSLCVEEHFYLFLPLIVLVMMRRPSLRKTVALIAVLSAAGIAIRSYVLLHDILPVARSKASYRDFYLMHIYYPTYNRLDGLMAGVALALIRLFRPAWWSALMRRGHLLTCSAAGLIGSAVWLFQDVWNTPSGATPAGIVIGFPILSLGLALLAASALSHNGLLSRVRVPGAKAVAILSFSLYLTHKEVYGITGRILPGLRDAGGYPWLAVLLCTCLGASSLLYFGVERPFLLLRDRHQRREVSLDRAMEAEPAL